MAKLHEHLAAEKNVTSGLLAIIKSMIDTFSKKSNFFDGIIRTYSPIDDEGVKLPDESERLRASATEELTFLNRNLAKFFDFKVTKEMTNTFTKADLIYDGKLIATDLSATALLSLESSLITMRDVYKHLPTRDIKEEWSFDDSLKVYKGKPKITSRTEKIIKHEVVVPPSDKFPAQIKEYSVMNTLGTWDTVPLSGRISTIEKSALLKNIDNMLVAVKAARSRANEQEVFNVRIGESIIDNIMSDVIQHSVKVDSDELNRLGL